MSDIKVSNNGMSKGWSSQRNVESPLSSATWSSDGKTLNAKTK